MRRVCSASETPVASARGFLDPAAPRHRSWPTPCTTRRSTASRSTAACDPRGAYLAHLFALWRPDSVVDIGCGRGAWLAACGERGVQRLTGLDGDWVSQEMMLDPSIAFQRANLQQEQPAGERHDLAISLEVAEHLPLASADGFVRTLAAHADAVVFGAAYVSQPGQGHINTQPHSFWANKFLAQGYRLFDFFRPTFWSDNDVEPWYRQNTFLYVRPEHPLHRGARRSRPGAAAGRPLRRLHPSVVVLRHAGTVRSAAAARGAGAAECGAGHAHVQAETTRAPAARARSTSIATRTARREPDPVAGR